WPRIYTVIHLHLTKLQLAHHHHHHHLKLYPIFKNRERKSEKSKYSNTNPAFPCSANQLPGPTTRRETDPNVLAQNPKQPPSQSPAPGPEPYSGQNPNVEIHSPATTVRIDALNDPIVDVGIGGGEGGVDGGLGPGPLREGRDSGLGEEGRLVENFGANLVVGNAHFLVGVVDGEADVPVAGDGGRGRGVEVGEGEGIDADFGEAGAEDEPDDEDDGGGDDEEGDHGGNEAAEEGGA
ncbi:hypothetical protein PanWU01x14_017140, partial [Parasponia andersonii]